MWGLGLGMVVWLFLNDGFTWGVVGTESLHFRGVTELRKGNTQHTQHQKIEEGRRFDAKNSFNSSLCLNS
jgi:hypothetical protein